MQIVLLKISWALGKQALEMIKYQIAFSLSYCNMTSQQKGAQ